MTEENNIEVFSPEEIARAQHLQYLVEEVQKGNSVALEHLCQQFTPMIKRQVKRSMASTSLKEDALGAAWEIFIRYALRYDGCDYFHLPGLFETVVERGLLKKSRTRSYFDPHIDDSQDISKLYFLSAPEDQLAKITPQLDYNLRKLKPKQRRIIELVDIDRNTELEASEILNIPCSTLRYHLYNARKILAELYTQQGI